MPSMVASPRHETRVRGSGFAQARDRLPAMSPATGTKAPGRQRARAGLTLLVDASSLIYRAFFAIPDTVRAPDGTQVNAAHGFLEMLSHLAVTYRPQFMVAALDDD